MSEPEDDSIVTRIQSAKPFEDDCATAVTTANNGAEIVDFAQKHQSAKGARTIQAANCVLRGTSHNEENSGKPPSRGKGDGESEPPRDEDDDGGTINRMNDEWAFCVLGSRAVIMRERRDGPTDDRLKFLSIDAFRAYYQNATVRVTRYVIDKETGDRVKKYAYYKLASWWLQHPERRTYDGIEFFPNPDGAEGTPRYLNLWRGFSVVPDRKTSAAERWKKYKIFRDHILTNICAGNQNHADWLFAWMAHIVQHPRQRPGTAVVMRGLMGTGKTIVGQVLGSLFEAHYFLVDDARYVTGQFNAHMASCIVLQADEACWAGDKSAEGRLKGLITAPKQMIEAKGVDPIRIDNHVRLMMSSNNDWIVPAGMDERRFAVFDVAENVKENRGYFAEMMAELDNGGREAFLADLLSLDLESAPDVHVIPKTEALLQQKLQSFDPITSWLYHRLMDGSMTRRASAWRPSVPIRTIYDDYNRAAEKMGVRRRQDEVNFAMHVRRIVPGIVRKKRIEDIEIEDENGSPSIVRKRVWCWEMPPLADCRAAFEAALYQTIDWGADDDEEEPNSAELEI